MITEATCRVSVVENTHLLIKQLFAVMSIECVYAHFIFLESQLQEGCEVNLASAVYYRSMLRYYSKEC